MKTLLVIAFWWIAFSFPLRGDEKSNQFYVRGSSDWKFLIITKTDNRLRGAHVTVFDVLRPSYQIRKLYDIELVNEICPKLVDVGCGGRFLVTMDTHAFVKDVRDAVVVYDMMRKEHSTYNLSDIFAKEAVENLGTSGPLAYGWQRGGGHLSNTQQEFYLTAPDFYATFPSDQLPPFVVVDLPTRAFRIERKPSNGTKMTFKSSPKAWKIENVSDSNTTSDLSLPQALKFSTGEGTWVRYRLNANSKEYDVVPSDKVR